MNSSQHTERMLFHKFVWYVWMPISFLVSLYAACVGIGSYYDTFGGYMDSFQVALIGIIYVVFEIIFVAAPAFVFIGFFKQRKYAWYILVIESVSNIVTSPILLILNASAYEASTVVGRVLGIMLDIAIVIYYWKHRRLFRVGKIANAGEAAAPVNDEPCMRFCFNCGNKLETGDLFCNKCGAKIK